MWSVLSLLQPDRKYVPAPAVRGSPEKAVRAGPKLAAIRHPPAAIRQPPAAEEPLRSPRQQLPGHPRLRLPPSYAALHTPPKPQRTSWE